MPIIVISDSKILKKVLANHVLLLRDGQLDDITSADSTEASGTTNYGIIATNVCNSDLEFPDNELEIDDLPSTGFLDPAEWPPLSEVTRDLIIRNITPLDNLKDIDLKNSKRVYATQTRSASISMFFSKMKNGQSSFNDWKHECRFSEHERSHEHRSNLQNMVARGEVLGKIDTALHAQYLKEVEYWHEVLRRIVSVIEFLGKRGLAFRGSNELIGSSQNGNFLGIIELLAEYDPFLKTHLETRVNKGKGHVSYLSKNVCNEFIELMFEEMTKKIIDGLKASKYYLISVDSSPDITHCDQLTFILRMIAGTGEPMERFIQFISQPGHSANDLEVAVLKTLTELDMDIKDCRG
ncbi:zinc finger MYM-type protein 1-like [Diprion similis]|uniref:zinc finger MYM-type protein 1-like n=1 Tax=Diprion similis TaxID=362088 RepID=UPI001EF7BA45|nr:zinc finger MYM-type protein 1-like [Diprion similis]